MNSFDSCVHLLVFIIFRLYENPEGEGHKYTSMAALIKVRGMMDRQHSLPEHEHVTDPVRASHIRMWIVVRILNVRVSLSVLCCRAAIT